MNKKYYDSFAVMDAITDFMEQVGNIQGADVVEVVRCKDCEFNDDGYRCPFREAGWGYDPDRYCSFGERKEG